MNAEINENLNNENKESNNLKSKNSYTNNTNTNQSESIQVLTSSKVDLSEIEASEENLQNYSLSKQFLKLDLEKIREIIEILEEYYQSCIGKHNADLANKSKQRIILLKRIEKEKMIMEAKIIYSNQRELIQDKMNEDLDNYISNSNQEYEALLEKINNQEKDMIKTQEEELNEFKKNFEQNYQELKPSKESLNWMKIRDYAIKQNKFIKVREAQDEIDKLKEKDNIKYLENKEKKLKTEINNIMHRHNIEKNGFEMKKKSIIEKFNKNKNDDIEIIKKKYESKLKELQNYQNFEISNFDKITKGVIKPCSRIQNIVSSTTGIKDEEEDENESNNEKNKENENEEENKENKESKEKKENEENEENEEKEGEESVKLGQEQEQEQEENDLQNN